MSAPSSLPALSAPKIRPPINPVRGFSIPCPSHIAPGHTSQWILLLVFLRLKVTLPYSQLLTASPNLLTLLLFPNSPQLERLLTSLSSMCFVCMVCLLMLSLTGVPNSSPKSGRLSARPLEPPPACPPVITPNLMARQNGPTKNWKLLFVVSSLPTQYKYRPSSTTPRQIVDSVTHC